MPIQCCKTCNALSAAGYNWKPLTRSVGHILVIFVFKELSQRKCTEGWSTVSPLLHDCCVTTLGMVLKRQVLPTLFFMFCSVFSCCIACLYVTILEGIVSSNMDHLNSNTAGMIYMHTSFSGKVCSGLTSNLLSIPFPMSSFADDIMEYQLHFCPSSCPEYIFCPVLSVATVTRYETSVVLISELNCGISCMSLQHKHCIQL